MGHCQRSIVGLSWLMMGETIWVAAHHDIVRTRRPIVVMPSFLNQARRRIGLMGF
jgi:hypothetical protein